MQLLIPDLDPEALYDPAFVNPQAREGEAFDEWVDVDAAAENDKKDDPDYSDSDE